MQRHLPLLLGFAVSAAIGVAAAALVFDDDPEIPGSVWRSLDDLESRLSDLEQAPAPVAGRGEERADLRADEIRNDFAALRIEGASLRDRMEALEASGLRPAPSGATAAAPGPEEPSAEVPPGELEEKVREVVAEAERKRWEERGKRFAAMAEQRENSLLDRFAEEQGVSPNTRAQLDQLLARRRTAIGQFFRTMFAEGSDTPDLGAIRQKMTDVRAETDEAIQQILTPEQYSAFQEVDGRGMRGPWGGGRRSGGR